MDARARARNFARARNRNRARTHARNLTRTRNRTQVTTTLAASSGGMTAVFFKRFGCIARTWEVPAMCNGVLAGLVSITSGCATLEPWAAVVTGMIGGIVFHESSKLLLRWRVDDPLDAAAVHGACGIWGLLAAALFSSSSYTGDVYGIEPGLFYPGSTGQSLAAALVFILATIAWTGTTSYIIFLTLNIFGVLRMPYKLSEAEIDMDASIAPPMDMDNDDGYDEHEVHEHEP